MYLFRAGIGCKRAAVEAMAGLGWRRRRVDGIPAQPMKLLARLALPLLILAAGALAGCNFPVKFATDQQEAVAKGWLQQLRDRHFDAIEAAADDALRTDALRPELEKMADAIPPGEPTSVVLVGDQHFASSAGNAVNLTYEYDYGGRYLLANVAVRTKDGVSRIIGMSAHQLSQPLEAQHRFELGGHAPVAYLALAGAILMPLFSLAVLVLCIRTPLKGRKWPWILFILVGFCSVSVNWATDAWAFQVLSFQALSASVLSTGPYSPWVIGFSLPVGAVLFLAWRRELKAAPPAAPVAAESTAA